MEKYYVVKGPLGNIIRNYGFFNKEDEAVEYLRREYGDDPDCSIIEVVVIPVADLEQVREALSYYSVKRSGWLDPTRARDALDALKEVE